MIFNTYKGVPGKWLGFEALAEFFNHDPLKGEENRMPMQNKHIYSTNLSETRIFLS